ncbi:methyltransferase [Synechococcus sp. CS-1328]|uniref:methyltransferase family protein n=1 Tax=Synechococcus sp. CS-1328 TaxID=2847976 RepID=UPI00223A7B05|nr:methyltransferase [Synechococcus sp. CS-1328]MCT0224241.1 hypothetical protein [Synechococcus sp. CS-1328]
MKPVHACDHTAILAQGGGVFQSLLKTLLQLATGHDLPRCLHAVANLGVADALDNTSHPVAALAEATGSDPEVLDRVLRILASHGIFEFQDGRVAHTPESLLLRADHPGSMRSLVRMFGLSAFWASIGEPDYSIRAGKPYADKMILDGIWGYLSSDLDVSRIFGDAMTGKAHRHISGILEAYDFSAISTIMDIGGGRGHPRPHPFERLFGCRPRRGESWNNSGARRPGQDHQDGPAGNARF